MKYAIAASILLMMTGTASAIERVDIQNMSCGQIQDVLKQQRAAILRYPSPSGSGRILYDRYVYDPIICSQGGEYPVQRFIPATDSRRCMTYSCQPSPPDCSDAIDQMFCRFWR